MRGDHWITFDLEEAPAIQQSLMLDWLSFIDHMLTVPFCEEADQYLHNVTTGKEQGWQNPPVL